MKTQQISRLFLAFLIIISAEHLRAQVPIVGSTGTFNGGLTVSGLSTINSPTGNTFAMGWNHSGYGEGDFFDYSTGTTSFNWYGATSGTLGTPLMSLSQAGGLTVETALSVPTLQSTSNFTANTMTANFLTLAGTFNVQGGFNYISNTSQLAFQAAGTGYGDTDFINMRGTGTGGFNWYTTASSTLPSAIAHMTQTGDLNLTGYISLEGITTTRLQTAATQPTGSCSVIAWIFSTDGHITFCNGSTYVSKV